MAKVTRSGPTPRKKTAKKTAPKRAAKKSSRKGTTRKVARSSRGKKLVLYGPPGSGKTSVAAYGFGPPGTTATTAFVIDSQEEGVLDLIEYGRIPDIPMERIHTVDQWKGKTGLLDVLDDVAASGVTDVVVDSLTGMEKLCHVYHCNENFDGDWGKEGFMAYHKGPKQAAKTDWPDFLDLCDEVARAGVNVCLIAHSVVKTNDNPEGPDFPRYIPYLDKETWSHTHRWAAACFFLNYHVRTEKSEGLKTKADTESSEGRNIFTEWSPAYDAKNRYGMDPVIPMGDDAEEAHEALVKQLYKGVR